MDRAAIDEGKGVSLLGLAMESPVIIQVKGFTPLPYLQPETLKKLRQDALGATVGGVDQARVFDVWAEWTERGIMENEYSVVCGNRRSAAQLLWRIRAMRRQKYWTTKWLKSSWLRLVTCHNHSINISVNSSRGCFVHRLKRADSADKAASAETDRAATEQ